MSKDIRAPVGYFKKRLEGKTPEWVRKKMMLTISELRKSRGTEFGKITEALAKKNDYSKDDEGYFKLERDKAGNASAVIRFLPKQKDDDLPWVQMYNHAFQGPSGKWYIENCRSTIGEADPVNDMNRKAYASGTEADKEEAKKRKRKTSYIAQVCVISDPKHPENEGKVLKFKFGKKIFDKIMDKVQPTFEDDKPVNVFDLWEGCEFKLRMHQADGYPSYDKSTFSDPKPIAESDEEILEIVNQQKSLKELVAPGKFKSYDELEKKLRATLSDQTASTKKAEQLVKEMQDEVITPPTRVEPKAKEEPKANAPDPKASEDDSSMEEYFRSLAT